MSLRKIGQIIFIILLDIFLCLLVIEAGLRIRGYLFLSAQEKKNKAAILQKGAYRIMCLGDSSTQNQYPSLLEKALNRRNLGVKFSVIDKGLSGVSSTDIVSQIELNLDKYAPQMVVVMTGTGEYGFYVPYETAAASKITLFLRSLKIYKLVKLIWRDFPDQARKAEIYRANGENTRLAKNRTLPSGIMLPEAQSKFVSVEEELKKVIALNPRDDQTCLGLGWVYCQQGKFSQAEEVLQKAIALNPEHYKAYLGLEYMYCQYGKFSQAEAAFQKVIAFDPQDYRAYLALGRVYARQDKFSQAEAALQKATELNPKSDTAYIRLGCLYWRQGKASQAEEVFKKWSAALNLESDLMYGMGSILYEEIGKPELAREYAEKANRLRSAYYNPVTVNNYRKIREILERRRVRLVCLQYPMRSIAPLKKIFAADEEGIIFVDNAQVFKDAVKQEGYGAYFNDISGGDFGHCTLKGNALLAENIAREIAKEVFRQ